MSQMQTSPQKFGNFREFWAFYLSEHSDRKNRRLHVIGTFISLILLIAAAVLENPWLLGGAVVSGYAFAWVGHFFLEKNRPATFRAPFYSLLADYRMFYLTLNGRIDAEMTRVSEQNGSIKRQT